ncbi:MAG TPA: serine hydrolase [Chthoniobacterales bacterium]
MIRRLLPILLLLAGNCAAPAAASKPLGEAAAGLAAQLPKGGIVTGESAGGPAAYALAGNVGVAGVPPERILFEIGSISKVFTGLLLAQAVVEGRVKLDAPIRDLLEPKQTFADARVGAITLRQLAAHTSGLPRLPEELDQGANPGDPYAHYDRARLEAGLARLQLAGDAPFPRSYSNYGAGLLGDLLSRLYGKPWETLVREKIAGPLGLPDTVVRLDADQQRRFAPPFSGNSPAHPWNLASLEGAGALRSTAADLMAFGAALLHPGQTPLREALELLLAPQSADGAIGLGISLSRLFGERGYEHSGGTGGFASGLYVLPESGSVKVILINNAVLSDGAVLAATHSSAPPRESARAFAADELAEFTGVYPLDSMSRFTLLLRGGQLWVRLSGQPFFPLHPHATPDRFFLKVVPAEIQFERKEGAIQSLTLFQNGRETQAAKSPEPAPVIDFRSDRELASLAGAYAVNPEMNFTVKVRHSTLFVKLNQQPALPVFETSKDWFEYDVVSAALEFERDKENRVVALWLFQNGAAFRAAKKD